MAMAARLGPFLPLVGSLAALVLVAGLWSRSGGPTALWAPAADARAYSKGEALMRQAGARLGRGRQSALFEEKDFYNGKIQFPQAGLNSVHQVVKSVSANIGMQDRKWDHQTYPRQQAPMQEWPMTTAGMRGRTQQLVGTHKLGGFKKMGGRDLGLAQETEQLGKIMARQEKAAYAMSRYGDRLIEAANSVQ